MKISPAQIKRIIRDVKRLVPQVTDIEIGVRASTKNSLLWGEEDDLEYTMALTPPAFEVRETETGEVVLDLYVYTENDGLRCNLDAHLERGSNRIRVYDPLTEKERDYHEDQEVFNRRSREILAKLRALISDRET
jgi:hypothetical protein